MTFKLHGAACGLLALTLAQCASVDVTPINAQGYARTDEEPGIRYYMPKPYLLVTAIPTDKLSSLTVEKAPGGGATDPGGTGQVAKQDNTTPSPSSSSELGYQLGNTTYLLKLVYLPDMSKGMAINIRPSILGTSSVQPTLQDGWMLTSMTASADNTKALDDLTTLVTTLAGGGAKSTTSASTKSGTSAQVKMDTTPPDLTNVLMPGLYEFKYDDAGHLEGLCTVSTFKQAGPDNTKSGAFCADLSKIRRGRPIYLK